jgi:hypothetical protein
VPDSPPPDDPQRKMQRLRVGVTGLAFVIVLLVVFFAVMAGVQRNAVGENSQTVQNVMGNATDPMAQLGVAPDGATNSSAKK